MRHPRALELLESRLPGWKGQFHRITCVIGRSKNAVVEFHRGEEHLVLKVYRHRLRYSMRVLCNPLSRYVTRSYRLSSTVGMRAKSELDCIDGFRRAGLATFDVIDRVAPDAILFRYCEGTDLPVLLRDEDVAMPRKLDYVRRVGRELSQRQEMALREGDSRLVHPEPRLRAIRVRPDDTLIHFDFEGRTNPSLPLPDLIVGELDNFLCKVIQSPQARDHPEFLKAAVEGVGAVAMERRRAWRPRWVDRFSRSARTRRELLARHLGETAPTR